MFAQTTLSEIFALVRMHARILECHEYGRNFLGIPEHNMPFQTFILKVVTVLSLALFTGVDFYSSPFDDTNSQFQELYSHLDEEHQSNEAGEQNHESDSHKCHGQVSCEIQTATPALRLVEIRTAKAELFVATESKDRSVYALHPEPPPPEV